MSYTNPHLFFGPGPSIVFTTNLTLPDIAYVGPNARPLVLKNFTNSLATGLDTLATVALNIGADAAENIAAIQSMVSAQLISDTQFILAFTSLVSIEYGLNISDNRQSITMYVKVAVGAISRQFFYSTVKANRGMMVGDRSYGNASD